MKNFDHILKEVRLETVESEYKRIKLFIGALAIGFLMMGFLFFVLEEVDSFFENPYTTTFIMLWNLTFIVYEFVALMIVRWHMKNQKIPIDYV